MKIITPFIRNASGGSFFPSFAKALTWHRTDFTIRAFITRMATTLIGLLLGVFLFSFNGKAQDCEALIRYRDVELSRQYNAAFDMYSVNKQLRMDIEKIRYELLSGDWHSYSTTFATSNAGLATAVIAKNIQTTCNLILGLLKLAPGAQLGAEAVEKTSLTATVIYKAIQSGQKLNAIVQEGAEKTAYREVLSLGNPLIRSVNVAWKLSEDIAKMAEMPKQQDELKKEVKRALDMVDTELAKYQKGLASSNARLKDIREVVAGIDKYLSAYCPKEKETKKAEKPAPAFQVEEASPAPVTTAKKKPASNNMFYVFLSASITVGKKSVHVISPPIMHAGEFSDDLSQEKEDFIQQVVSQFPNKPDRVQEMLRENNYQKISAHYSLPNSTSPLHGPQDARDAIDGFKRLIWEAIAGLPGAENVTFYQLR